MAFQGKKSKNRVTRKSPAKAGSPSEPSEVDPNQGSTSIDSSSAGNDFGMHVQSENSSSITPSYVLDATQRGISGGRKLERDFARVFEGEAEEVRSSRPVKNHCALTVETGFEKRDSRERQLLVGASPPTVAEKSVAENRATEGLGSPTPRRASGSLTSDGGSTGSDIGYVSVSGGLPMDDEITSMGLILTIVDIGAMLFGATMAFSFYNNLAKDHNRDSRIAAFNSALNVTLSIMTFSNFHLNFVMLKRNPKNLLLLIFLGGCVYFNGMIMRYEEVTEKHPCADLFLFWRAGFMELSILNFLYNKWYKSDNLGNRLSGEESKCRKYRG